MKEKKIICKPTTTQTKVSGAKYPEVVSAINITPKEAPYMLETTQTPLEGAKDALQIIIHVTRDKISPTDSFRN